MKKILIVLAGVSVPVAAFAAHVSHCCGNAWCCLLHLGCC
jgi:hypothetical protein